MFWSHVPIAPWQSAEWIEQMRGQLRPNAFLRMIENRFVSTESAFVDPEWIDRCFDPGAHPLLRGDGLPVFVGIDASVKKDSTAIAAVTFDPTANKVRLVAHRIFQPSSAEPLNFELTVERTVKELCKAFSVCAIRYDPYQMASVAQRLQSAGFPMREFPQTTDKLTDIGSNLYELIKGGNLVLYPDEQIKLALNRAVAKETPRGWKITKEKQSHKIDIVIAMAMAALNCVEEGQRQPLHWWDTPTGDFLPGAVNAPRQYPGDSGSSLEDQAYAALKHGTFRNPGSVCW